MWFGFPRSRGMTGMWAGMAIVRCGVLFVPGFAFEGYGDGVYSGA